MQPRRALLLLCLLCMTAQARASELSTDELLALPLESLLALPVSIASPFPENIADAASSVSVLLPEDWRRRGARSVEEAIEQVPGTVSYHSLGGARMTAVRGYATELSARGMATLLDGVPLNNFSYGSAIYDTPFFPLPLFARIEMIRGPGSTLYGSDAFHSVLGLHTPEADSAPATQARLAAGSRDLGEVAILGGGSAGALRSSAGLALTHHGNQALDYRYQAPDTGLPAQGERQQSLRHAAGFLHLEAGEDDHATGLWRLSIYADDYEADGFPGIGHQFYQALPASFDLASLDLARDRDRIGQVSDFRLGQLQHSRQLGAGLQFDARAYEWRSDQTWLLDLSRYPLTLTTTGGSTLDCRTSPGQAGVSPLYCPHTLYQGTADRRRGLELQLRQTVAPGNTEWAAAAGRDWLEVLDAPLWRSGLDGTVYVDSTSPFAGSRRHINHLRLHARSQFLENRLTLSYGLRWDDYSDVGDVSSPRFGAIYRFTPAWTGKLLYGHAFRAPTAAETSGAGPGSLQLPNPGIRPETIDTGELVLQHESTRQVRTLTAFYSRWQDGIVLNPVGLSQNQYQNIGKNHAYGIELTQQLSLGAWRLEANASWTHSVNDNAMTGGGSHAQEYSAFPAWLVNLGLGRRFASGWELWLQQRLMLDYAEGDAIAGRSPAHAPDYYRSDLHLSRTLGTSRLWLDIRNLFDRQNTLPALYNADGGLPDERRSLRLGLEWPLDDPR